MDWIESFLEYTDGTPAPHIFRLWSAIGAVAAALERRVFVVTAGETLYPNLYTLLVAPPGVGKSKAINRVSEIWKMIPELKLAPDNVTKPSLIDALVDASRKIVRSPVELLEFNSMQIAADELGVLLSSHDLDFLSVMNKFYDCPDFYKETRRTIKLPIEIPSPQLNLLAGTQPGFMASIFPEEAWGMGFTSRIIMVYSAKQVEVDLFDETLASPELRKNLVHDMKTMMHLFGKFKWAPDAAEAIQAWNRKDAKTSAPQHSKLEHYNARRILHVLKLCMVSSASRSVHLMIEQQDFRRAVDWLLEAEATMPDVFRNMAQKSDTEVIKDLHFFCWQIYAKHRQPIHEQRLVNFLRTKVPSDRIDKILEIADRAGIVKRQAGGITWTPSTKDALGIE